MTCTVCGSVVEWDVYRRPAGELHTVCSWCGAVDSNAETKAECYDVPKVRMSDTERFIMLDESLTAAEASAKLAALGYERSRYAVYRLRLRERAGY